MYPFHYNIFKQPQGEMFDSPYKNVMFGTPEEETSFQAPQAPQPPTFMDAYRELLTRKAGPAMSAYSKFLSEGAPQPDDYRPSKTTRLAAILSGAAAGFARPGTGSEVASRIVEEPYERGMQRYGMESDRLRQAAALEEGSSNRDFTHLKTLSDIQNTMNDNERATKAQDILNKSRELGMEKTQAELKLLGIETHVDRETGHLIGVNKLTKERTDYGQIGQSSSQRVAEHKKNAGVDLRNRKNFALFEVPLIDQRDEHRADLAFTNAQLLESGRQENRMQLEEARSKMRAAVTNKELLPGDVKVIRTNLAKVQSIIAADPNKYKDYWDADNQRLVTDIPEVGTDEYNDYVTLYNALYQGTSQLSPNSKYKVGRR